MPETIFRVTVQETSKNILNYNGIDATLNVNINDYKECYVMVERLLGASTSVGMNMLLLNLQGLVNNIGVSETNAVTPPSHVGLYMGTPQTINGVPMMLYNYECYTQNWVKVSLSTIGNIVLTTSFDLTNANTSTLYVILKFKFVK